MTYEAVLFDFHDTLVTKRSTAAWLTAATQVTGDAAVDEAAILPVLQTVWHRAARRDPQSTWDLDPVLHRRTFVTVMTEEAPVAPALADALYDVMPGQWIAVPGAVELVTALRAAGCRVGVVSNIALDIRPSLDALGFAGLLDAVVLSSEVGLVKPDPRIFRLAAERLGVAPHACLFVGDTPAMDGGAARAGLTTLLVPLRDDRPDLTDIAALLTH